MGLGQACTSAGGLEVTDGSIPTASVRHQRQPFLLQPSDPGLTGRGIGTGGCGQFMGVRPATDVADTHTKAMEGPDFHAGKERGHTTLHNLLQWSTDGVQVRTTIRVCGGLGGGGAQRPSKYAGRYFQVYALVCDCSEQLGKSTFTR